jgi:hypothetical protein
MTRMERSDSREAGRGRPPPTRWWLVLLLVLIGVVALARALAL